MKKDKYFGMSPRIAKWKKDNPFENWLSYRADKSEFWKFIYVLYYQLFDYLYYKGGKKYIEQALKDLSIPSESRKKVSRDMIYCLHRFGFSFQDYCIYDFVHHPSYNYRSSFVADKLRYHYCDILNNPEVEPLMTNKLTCYLEFKRFYKRDVVGCQSKKDFKEYNLFLEKHKQFIYKPLKEHSGHGIAIYKSSDINTIDFFYSSIEKGPFILEELIIQGKETANMHPQSINSCRVTTFTKNKDVTILGATWRIGVGNSFTDNTGSGGIYASIDKQSGKVTTSAINYKGNQYLHHPNTGIEIKNYQLPEWEIALALIHDMARVVKGATLVSWDIAYSNKGWLMVEANDNGDWSILQSNHKKGKKSELYYLMDGYFNNKCQ